MSLDTALILHAAAPRLAFVPTVKDARPAGPRSTTIELPESVRLKGVLIEARPDEALGSAKADQTTCAAASTVEGAWNALSSGFPRPPAAGHFNVESQAIIYAAISASVAFNITPSTAERIMPVSLTTIASSHSGHIVGYTDSGRVPRARVWRDIGFIT